MVTQNDRRLGEQIRKLRKDRGLKQDQLAEEVRISTKYLQFIEAGQRQPSLKTLYKIANALKVKVGQLFHF